MRNCLRAIPFFICMYQSKNRFLTLYIIILIFYFSDFLLLLYGGKVDKKNLTRIKQL